MATKNKVTINDFQKQSSEQDQSNMVPRLSYSGTAAAVLVAAELGNKP